jgi:Ca2+-binding RTX toxin-like protein
MPISDFLQQFRNNGVRHRFFNRLSSNETRRSQRLRSAGKLTQTEVCETRTLLAAAMTSLTTGTPDPLDLSLASDAPGPSKISPFIIDSRWTQTATNGGGLTQGDPTTLTWSLPANGVITDDYKNPNAPNNLLTFMDNTFGAGVGSDLTQRPWFHIFNDALGRLQSLGGLTYNFVTYDDGVAMQFNNIGILGQRADVRIMGKNVDGSLGQNILAYNSYPNDGDMIIDTSNGDYFDNPNNDFRAFRNTLMHEFMHGLGIDHVESSDSDFLIEPFASDLSDGPQLDDILAIQRSYGDALEKLGGNTFSTAIDLGTIASLSSVSRGTHGDSTVVDRTETDFVSIDDETDKDFYKFSVQAAGEVSITLSPRGTTYSVGPQNIPGDPVVPQTSFNSKNQSDLTVTLLGEDGVTVLQTQNAGGLGVNEVIEDFMVISPGTYYIQVTGATTDKIQLYGLDVGFYQAPGGQILGSVFNDSDGDGTQDAGELGLQNIRVYIDTNSSGSFDEGIETFVMTDASGDYVFDEIFDEGLFNIRAELPGNRQNTVPASGLHQIVLSFDEIVSNVNFGTRALPVGTSGSDAFVLTYSPTNVAITLSTNGGPASLIGTFPIDSPLVVDGAGGTDSVRIVGTSGLDEFYVASENVVLTNEQHQVTLTSIEQKTLAGAAGNDTYIFDTDVALGTFTLDEAGGGKDLLDFFNSDLAVSINLGLSTTQVVNANLSLILGAVNTFEDVEGGKGADKLTGNALNNMLSGNNGDDDLAGLAGDDTLIGGKHSDLYLFDADTQLGADSIVELFDPDFVEGYDLLDFRFTSTAVQIDLGLASQQTVNANLKLTLSANNVIDDVDGGSGDDRITGNAVGNFLDGFGGNDILIGLAGNDELDGMQGDDTYIFTNNGGYDVIKEAASAGTDTFDFSAVTSNVTVNLGVTTAQPVHASAVLEINNASAIEKVICGSGNDTITGNALGNTLNGGPGNDTLNGAGGHDTLVGGNGNDTYTFAAATAAGNNIISEVGTTGVDTINFASITSPTGNVSINLGVTAFQKFDALRYVRLDGAAAIENVIGGSGNDTITGNAVANNLNGGPGNDTLNGAGGHDTLVGGNGNDTYTFAAATAAGNNIISEVGTTGVDTINFASITSPTGNVSINLGVTAFQKFDALRYVRLDGAAAIENVIGGSGNDTITGNAVANNLSGGPGNDTLNGAGGHDTLVGGNGDDTYTFAAATAAGNNIISEVGTTGVDTINFASITSPTGNVSINLGVTAFQKFDALRYVRLDGAAAIENVIGGSGNDTITGNALANILNGGPGNDILKGEAGNDSLVGSTGDDTYVFGTASAIEADTVTEAASAGTDTLDFSAVTANLLLSLEVSQAQSVHTNRTLTVNGATAVENVIGGSGHDVLIGNSLSNRLTGNNGRDILVGNLGADFLFGGNDDDILVSGSVNIALRTSPVITSVAEVVRLQSELSRVRLLDHAATAS